VLVTVAGVESDGLFSNGIWKERLNERVRVDTVERESF